MELLLATLLSCESAQGLINKITPSTPNRDELARRNIDLQMFQNVISTALGGMKISESIQGRERYNIMLRYERKFRESAEDLANILVPTPMGQHIPLGEIATIEFIEGPPMIKSENARLTGWVFVDIEDRDIGSYVNDARKVIANKVKLPAGYSISWSGQFEQMQEAENRMKIAVPSAILIIFVLLMLHFGRLDRTLIIMLSLPFALIGGIWALYLANYNFSVAASVGFIALGGVAIETAVIMIIYLDQQLRDNSPKTLQNLKDCVINGATLRIRAILMTVSTLFVGLMPIFITDGLGSDVMRRIALPIIGGMITTTALTLIAVPVIYYLWEGRSYKEGEISIKILKGEAKDFIKNFKGYLKNYRISNIKPIKFKK